MALLRMSLVLLQSPCLGERLRRSHAFLYLEVMWKEYSRNEHLQEFHGKSLGSLVLSALDRMLLRHAIVLAK